MAALIAQYPFLAALLALVTLGISFGALLGYAAVRFRTEGNPIVEQINDILPQTQCGQCGYPGCRPYAEAIAGGDEAINKCPPGGEAGIQALADLLDVELGCHFDIIALPGNVMIFLAPATERAVVANLARHLGPDGLFVAGFQLGEGRLSLADYDDHLAAAGLVPVARWSTWDGEPFDPVAGDYAVSVHRRAMVAE